MTPDTALKVIFIDRDGTLVEEPDDHQVDSLAKVRFVPGVFAALARLREAGYRFVMVTNQDGLGTDSFPSEQFEAPQRFILEAFASQGIHFEAVFVCPHRPEDGCACRKPSTALVADWIGAHSIDRPASAVIGDRDTDLAFAAELGVRGWRVGAHGMSWASIVPALLARRAELERQTRETLIRVRVDLDADGPVHARTGIGFLDHMLEQLGKHAGISLQLTCEGDLQIDEHHTVEDCALALGETLRKAIGDKRGLQRYGFLLPMDEAQARVAIDLCGRPYAVFDGRFGREQVGALPTELVPHFFRSLADSLGAAIHIHVSGDNTHHMIEACFKGVGRALRMAMVRDGTDLPSTKGVL